MAGPIRIISDTPTSTPGLGFDDYVNALGDAIRGAEPAQLTIGLYGAWGSGKSSLLAALASNLAPTDEILVVSFDAWRYERAEHIVVPLLHRVVAAGSSRTRFLPTVAQLKRFLGSLMKSLSFTSPIGVNVDGKELAAALNTGDVTALDTAFSQPFDELRKIQSTLKGERIVVLVDDLDRCSPDKVVGLLEAINLILDIEGFVFVLALDYEVLVEAVREKYGYGSPHLFIEKMVQLPFRVPPLQMDPRTLMRDLIPMWEEFVFSRDDDLVDLMADVSETALRGNPRQIKRMVNYVLLLERIVENRRLGIATSSLVRLIGFQLAWPEHYRLVQESVLLDVDDPFKTMQDELVPQAVKYARDHLSALPRGDALKRLFQLTSAVESAPTLTAPPSRADQKSVVSTLKNYGWEVQSPLNSPGPTLLRNSRTGARITVTDDGIHVLQNDAKGQPLFPRAVLPLEATGSLIELMDSGVSGLELRNRLREMTQF